MSIPLILGSLLGWGLWSFLNKLAIIQKVHPIWVQIIGCFIGVALIPFYLRTIKTQNIPVPTLHGVLLVCLASLSATLASICYMYNIKAGDVGTISALSASYPIITFILAAIFLGESFTLTKIIGIMFVVFGIVILGR